MRNKELNPAFILLHTLLIYLSSDFVLIVVMDHLR